MIAIQTLILGNNSTLTASGNALYLNGQMISGASGGYVLLSQTGDFAGQSKANLFTNTNVFSNNLTLLSNLTFGGTGPPPKGIIDVSGNFVLSPSGRTLFDNRNTGAIIFSTFQRQLMDSGFLKSMDWNLRGLYDTTSKISLAWNTGVSGRKLYNTSQIPTLDWQNLTLTGGNWTIQGLSTGAWTGIYYPLTSNPSGYVNSSQTGNYTNIFYPLNSNPSHYLTTGQTGIFVSYQQTGVLSGSFYPLSSNPSNYITNSQTGIFSGSFYSIKNPSGYITSGQTGILVGKNQTGLFYPTSNPSGFVTGISAGISSIIITGKSISGTITITGAGSITITTGQNNSVVVSGNNSGGSNIFQNFYRAGTGITTGDPQYVLFSSPLSTTGYAVSLNFTQDPRQLLSQGIYPYVIEKDVSGFSFSYDSDPSGDNLSFDYIAWVYN